MSFDLKTDYQIEVLTTKLRKTVDNHPFTTYTNYAKECDCCKEKRELVYSFPLKTSIKNVKSVDLANIKNLVETNICLYCVFGLLQYHPDVAKDHVFYGRANTVGLFDIKPQLFGAQKELHVLVDEFILYMEVLNNKGYTGFQDYLNYLGKPNTSSSKDEAFYYAVVYMYLFSRIGAGSIRYICPNAEYVPFGVAGNTLSNLQIVMREGRFVLSLNRDVSFNVYLPEFVKCLMNRILEYKSRLNV